MNIAKLDPITLLDYPGHLSALIYTVGCTMRCPFCHNPELATGNIRERISQEKVIEFMKERKGKLDALAITGGEPTLHRNLVPFMKNIKALGFKIKLDTYGLNPDRTREILEEEVVDYWAMDVKGDHKLYAQCNYKGNSLDPVQESIELLKEYAPDYELRTTFVKHKYWHGEKMAKRILQRVKGAKNYYIQNFRPGKIMSEELNDKKYSFTEDELQAFAALFKDEVAYVGIRS